MKYLIILFVLLAILQAYKPKIKGFFGERRIANIIKKLPQDEYMIINDV